MKNITKLLFALSIIGIAPSYADSNLPPPDAPFTVVGNKKTAAYYDDMGAKAVEIIYPWALLYSNERKTAAIGYSISNFRLCLYPPSTRGKAFIYIESSSHDDYVFIESGDTNLTLGIKPSVSDPKNGKIVHGTLLSDADFNNFLQSMKKNQTVYYMSGKIRVPLAGPYASLIANNYIDYTNTYMK